jgi:hypothetical protein
MPVMVTARARTYPETITSANPRSRQSAGVRVYINSQATGQGYVEIYTARAKLTPNERIAEHCSRARAYRIGLIALPTTGRDYHDHAVDSGRFWADADQG